MLLNEEDEKKKREEDIKRLFGTKNSEENINKTPKVEISDAYNKRIQDVKNLFGIDDEIEEPVMEEETEDTEITPPMIVTNTNPSDVAKPAYEWTERQKDTNNSGGFSSLGGRSSRLKTDSQNIDEKQLKEIKSNTNTVTAQNNNNGNKAISNFRAGQNSNTVLNAENSEEDKSLWDIIVDEFKREVDTIAGIGGNFVLGATDTFTAPANWIQAFETWGEKTATEQLLKLVGYSDEDAKKAGEIVEKNSKNSIYSKLNTLYTNNPEVKQWKNNTIQENIEKASSNPVTKYLAELAPSIGSNLVPMAISAVNPVLGSALFMLQAGGSYLDDAKARGMSDDEALGYATIMGILEGGSEAIITGSMVSKIGKALIGKGLSKEVLNSWGVNILENFAQEALMEPSSELTAEIFGGPDAADWDNMGIRMLQAGISGIVSSIILGGASVGIASSQKILNETNLTTDDYAQAVIDTINSGEVDVDGIVNGAQQAIINNGGTQQFYTTTFNQDGNVENVKAVRGKEISNPNSNVNVAPVIIKNENDLYNVIDKNTGILLDSTPYTTLIEAQSQFNDKINNLDNASINNINNQIAQATIAIDNKINEMASNIGNENVVNPSQSGTENVINDTQTGLNNVMSGANSGINNTNVNTNTSTNTSNDSNINTDTYHTSQNQFTDNYNNETINYSSNSTNASTSQNNGLQDVSKLLSQISDSSVYNRQKTRAIIENVSKNIPTIEIQQVDNTTYINSLDREGNVVYQQQVANRPYTGGEIRDLVNDAVYNADLSGINTAQTNQNEFRDVSNNETINYASQNTNENVGQNKTHNKKIFNNYDSETASRITSTDRNVIIKNTTQLNELIDEALDTQSNKALHLGKLDEDIIAEIKAEIKNLPKDNKNFLKKDSYDLVINQSEIRHLKEYKDNLTRKDIKKFVKALPDLIINNDYVSYTDNVKGKGLRFKKTMSDGTYVSFVLVSNKKSTMRVKTIYMEKSDFENKKRSISPPNDVNNVTPDNTSETSGASASLINTSISQQNKNVKSNTGVNNQSMQNNENNTKNSNLRTSKASGEKNIRKSDNNSASNEQKAIQKELHNRIQNAILSRNSKGRTYLGDVSTKISNKIKSLFGFEVSDRRHVLADNDIRHMIKEHGNPEIEKAKGQIAITTKDIEKIPDIIENYDRIVEGNDNREGKTIRYIKNYSDNISYVVEVVPEKGNALKIKTMWKKPVRVTNSKNTPSSTSKTKSGLGVSTSSKSIPHNNQNVKDSGIRAERTSSMSNSKIEYDSKGNKLSKSQQEFFKDSKVRDEKGKLLVMYHGTDKNFFEFKNKKPQHGRAIIDGYYLTPERSIASEYGSNIMEVYVDLKNPLYLHNNNGLTKELMDRGYANSTSELIEKYNLETDESEVVPTSKALTKLIKKLGYDGVITTTLDSDNIDTDYEYTQIVALKSNQIKNITNQNPTSSQDIRYEKKNKSDNSSEPYDERKYEKNEDFVNYLQDHNYLKTLMEIDNNQGETYAHSPNRLIEQEIRKVDSTTGFDNTIPVTKLMDIDREIEKYLKRTIGKGHFRERARGIYNRNIDRIRVKEYKDLDNVFHELGHALDLGGRITVDKASLSDELLAAVRRHGGYENESIGVQLDEGFAEILKTYAINKDIVKQDYPKSYKVLEDFKASNVEFGNFITKLQEDTYNYIHQSPRNRGLSNQSIGEQTDKETITIEKIAHKAVKTVYDSNYEVKRMQEEFSKATGHKPTPSQNAYLLTRLASGVDNKIVSMLTNGYVDENGNRLMPGLGRIGEILGNDPERISDLRAYLAARRDLEYKAKTLKTGLRTMDSKTIIEQFYNDAQIQEAAQVVYDTLDGVLQYAVDNGLITEENAKSLRESNVFYVPFQRVIEGRGNQVGRRGAVSDIIKQRTGSELDIKDVLENIVTNSANIIKQVENNNILRAVYEQGEETGMKNNVFDVIPAPMRKIGTEQLSTWEAELKRQGIDTSNLDLDKTIDLFAPNNNIVTEKDGSQIVSFFDKNGKRKYLQFYKGSTDIFNSLMGLDKNANSTFLKIMRSANMPLRYGATMANVGFAIPNMISDTVQASIFSEAGFIPVVDNVLGVLDVLGATNKTVRNFLNQVAPEYAQRINNLYDIYQQTGATSSMRMAQYRKSAQEIMRDIYGTKNSESLGIKESFKPLKRLMDILTYIPELSESSTRFRVFERNYDAYINKGMSETDARIQAAIESRDATQDFGRTGTLMREVNQLIPFSAARVGSAYTFAERAKANPRRTVARVAILLAITMAIKAIGYDDDEIEELNQRKKDDNFVLKIGDTVITIKKPQGILRSIVNLTEYIQDLFTGHIEEGKEGERLVEWATNAIMDNMPADSVTGLVPNAIAPVVENAINKDFYYNTDIVKSYDLDLPEAQQYYDYTSQFAIWLGQIFNYSPAKIDNLISGYLGGVGTQLTDIIDWVSGKLGFSVEEPDMGAEDNAIGKRFVVNVNENSSSVDEIYEREEELTKKLNGGTITEKENAELESIKSGISKISALNKQIKAIKQDLSMPGSAKADAIRPLQEQKVDVARQALGKDAIYTNNTDELESLEFYPSRSELSLNGLTLELTEEMKTEYMNMAYELYQKYTNQGLYNEEYLEKIKTKVKDAAKKKMMQKYRSQLVE